MKTTTEKRKELSKKLFKDLYYQGNSMQDIKDIAKDLQDFANYQVEKNTIGGLSNGHLIELI